MRTAAGFPHIILKSSLSLTISREHNIGLSKDPICVSRSMQSTEWGFCAMKKLRKGKRMRLSSTGQVETKKSPPLPPHFRKLKGKQCFRGFFGKTCMIDGDITNV